MSNRFDLYEIVMDYIGGTKQDWKDKFHIALKHINRKFKYYYMDDCSYCKIFNSIWNKFKEEHPMCDCSEHEIFRVNTFFNTYSLKIDCVDAVPTIIANGRRYSGLVVLSPELLNMLYEEQQ